MTVYRPSDPDNPWWAWGPLELEPPEQPAADAGGEGERGEARLAVDCFALLKPGGVRGQVEDISPGGLFLRAARTCRVGSPVRVIVSTANGPIVAEGVVRWTRGGEGADQDPRGPAIGIEFTLASPERVRCLAFRSATRGAAKEEENSEFVSLTKL